MQHRYILYITGAPIKLVSPGNNYVHLVNKLSPGFIKSGPCVTGSIDMLIGYCEQSVRLM